MTVNRSRYGYTFVSISPEKLIQSIQVRCEFVQGERKCRRCQAKGLPCQPRERKKRKPAEYANLIPGRSFCLSAFRTHEELQERSHEKDMQIQDLLRQYDQRMAEQKVHHWISKAPASHGEGLSFAGVFSSRLFTYDIQ